MKELEPPGKVKSAIAKVAAQATHPTRDQLRAMTTDELVKMLLSPEMARSMNEPLRQQIIEILQRREGNAFVQRILGKSTKKK